MLANDRTQEAIDWISEILNVEFDDLTALKDGVLLVRLVNELLGRNLKYSESKLVFKQMENLQIFFNVCREVGVREFEMFQSVDLVEGKLSILFNKNRLILEKNLGQVVNCIFALARTLQKNNVQCPQLGPKEATANKRVFSEEVLNTKVVPLLNSHTSKGVLVGGGRREIGGVYMSDEQKKQLGLTQDSAAQQA